MSPHPQAPCFHSWPLPALPVIVCGCIGWDFKRTPPNLLLNSPVLRPLCTKSTFLPSGHLIDLEYYHALPQKHLNIHTALGGGRPWLPPPPGTSPDSFYQQQGPTHSSGLAGEALSLP
uniref:Uncharacterized protein n=1 Tax=Gopherus evgoodei TaxID=1825980 RepID=A0A8C4YJ85_9SAUR